MPRLALVLPPRRSDVYALLPALGRVDAVVVTPETTWRAPGEDFAPNGYAALFRQVQRDRPRVAHAVAFGLGSVHPGEDAHHAAWLTALARDHAATPADWLSDHAIATRIGGEDLRLPLPLPFTTTLADVVQQRLLALRAVSGRALIETSAWPFRPPDLALEAAFLHACTRAPGTGLLLDLHNVWTNAQNFDLDPHALIAALPLDRVVEVHVSGGRPADPTWAPGPPMRLDSHDDAVPEAVFDLLTRWLPHLPALRQVTLERMEGTLDTGGDLQVEAELDRLAGILQRRTPSPCPAAIPPAPLPDATPADHLAFEHWLAPTLRGVPTEQRPAPPERFQPYANALHDDVLHVARMLVAKLRFERLMAGSRTAPGQFAQAPAAFSRDFGAYHRSVAPTWVSAAAEGEAWDAFQGA